MTYHTYTLIYPDLNLHYIGSTDGIRKRWLRHIKELKENRHHNVNMQRLYNNGYLPQIGQIFSHKTREEAYLMEKQVIELNLPKGILLNILIGGRGGDALTNNPNRADIISRISTTLKTKMSELSEDERKAKFGLKGERNGMFGKTHTPEVRKYLSENNIGRTSPNKGIPMSKDRYAMHMIAMSNRDISGEKNPFYGKSHSEETREKIRLKATGRESTAMKSVSIDNTIYPSYTHASNAMNISLTTVRHRCLSDNDKFKNWILL